MQFMGGVLVVLATVLCSLEFCEGYDTSEVVLQIGRTSGQISVTFQRAYVDAHIREAVQKMLLPTTAECNSLMGPTCFYTETHTDTQGCLASPSNISTRQYVSPAAPVASEKDAEPGGGIMAQYLEASQGRLGAIHGQSHFVNEQLQRVGAASAGGLDDVMYVRVGRGGSVRLVYERDESMEAPAAEAGAQEVCQIKLDIVEEA